jgi:hypothetical protein
MVEELLRGNENSVFGNSASMGKTEEIAKKAPPSLDQTQTRGQKKKTHRRGQGNELTALENEKSCGAHFPRSEEDLRIFQGQIQGTVEEHELHLRALYPVEPVHCQELSYRAYRDAASFKKKAKYCKEP